MRRDRMQVAELDRPFRPTTSSLSVRDWKALCRAYKGRCAYCGKLPDVLVIEHNLPQGRGGSDTIENILPACKSCNSEKNDLTPMEWICVQAGLARRDVKKRGIQMPRPVTYPEKRRGWYYPHQAVVRVEGDNEVLECGHVRRPRPLKGTATGYDTGTATKRVCIDCGHLSWGVDAQCICIADTTDIAVEAAARLTGALTNGEPFTDEDFATLRDWSADMQWFRINSDNMGPHHDRDCPHWLASYPADEQGAA